MRQSSLLLLALALEDVITLTEVTPGDMTCYASVGAWNTQTVDPSCVSDVPIEGEVDDFESGDGVSGLKVEIWNDDRVDGAADATMFSTDGGVVAGGNGPTCTAFAARVTSTDNTTIPTVQQHWSEPFSSPMDAFFNSVSTDTLALMTAIMSITPDPTKGVLAGTAYDCGGEGSELQGIQVIVRAADGTYPASQKIRYFIDEFPSVTQKSTSEDGLWLVADVPAGDVVVEAYAITAAGGEPMLIAQTTAQVFANTVTVADVYTGSEDGAVLPGSCTAVCGVTVR